MTKDNSTLGFPLILNGYCGSMGASWLSTCFSISVCGISELGVRPDKRGEKNRERAWVRGENLWASAACRCVFPGQLPNLLHNFLTNMVLTKVVKKKKFDKGADILFCALTPINGSVV